MLIEREHYTTGLSLPENGGEDPPKPPPSLKGVKYALEWGEDPPKPPSSLKGVKYAL